MPLYEYRCHTCSSVFTEQRPMARSSEPARCPDGHDDARRVLSVFATSGRATSAPTASMPAPSFGGGGCGSGCGCH